MPEIHIHNIISQINESTKGKLTGVKLDDKNTLLKLEYLNGTVTSIISIDIPKISGILSLVTTALNMINTRLKDGKKESEEEKKKEYKKKKKDMEEVYSTKFYYTKESIINIIEGYKQLIKKKIRDINFYDNDERSDSQIEDVYEIFDGSYLGYDDVRYDNKKTSEEEQYNDNKHYLDNYNSTTQGVVNLAFERKYNNAIARINSLPRSYLITALTKQRTNMVSRIATIPTIKITEVERKVLIATIEKSYDVVSYKIPDTKKEIDELVKENDTRNIELIDKKK